MTHTTGGRHNTPPPFTIRKETMRNFITHERFTACDRVWETLDDSKTRATFKGETEKASPPFDNDTRHELWVNACSLALDIRAHGLPESEVQACVRQFVRGAVKAGGHEIEGTDVPNYGCNAAVRFLAQTVDQYPMTRRGEFAAGIAMQAGMTRTAAKDAIADAINAGLIIQRKGRFGRAEFWLAHEPITDAMERLARTVAENKDCNDKWGVYVRKLSFNGARILGLGKEKGLALAARCVNARLLVPVTFAATWDECGYTVATTEADKAETVTR